MLTKKFFMKFIKNFKIKLLTLERDTRKKSNKLIRAIFDINNNLDKMYMDKLKGVLQEEDYVRVSGKLSLERDKTK